MRVTGSDIADGPARAAGRAWLGPSRAGRRLAWLAGLAAMAACGLAPAARAYTKADLGGALTPFGAIAAGNAAGTIPAWDGGTTRRPAGSDPRAPLANPYAGEAKLFSITAANVAQYEDRLSPGTAARLRSVAGWRIDVYPSHRNFAAPRDILDAAIANASRARLINGGLGVEGAARAIPFPLPQSGEEAVWNHLLRWKGLQMKATQANAVVGTDGRYTLARYTVKVMFPYNRPEPNPEGLNNAFFLEVLSPPRIAGGMTITKDYVDPYTTPRQAWFYSAGERRVRRAPNVGYDTPIGDTDGLQTIDDIDLFNGALDRYDWKLLGRREMYIPYNCYELNNPSHDYSDIIQKDFVNPSVVRWELHRVWVVEATLKPGRDHAYAKRMLFLDEDSWQTVISDRWDRRGLLWRTATIFPVLDYDVPVMREDGTEYVDLIAHRYIIQGLHGREVVQPRSDGNDLTLADFSPDVLRNRGMR